MSGEKKKTADTIKKTYCRLLQQKERRKLQAKKDKKESLLRLLGSFGLIGWTVAVPTIIGAFLGRFLDRHYPGKASWTVTLLIFGIAVGAYAAARWVSREYTHVDESINKKKEDLNE